MRIVPQKLDQFDGLLQQIVVLCKKVAELYSVL